MNTYTRLLLVAVCGSSLVACGGPSGEDALAGAQGSAVVAKLAPPPTSQAGVETSTMTLTVTPNTTSYGQPVTLTARVVATNPLLQSSVSGQVTFSSDLTGGIATFSLVGGQASFTTTTIASGTHLLTAAYAGNTLFDVNQAQASLTVSKVIATATLDSAPASPVFGESVLMTAVFAPPPPSTRFPTGTVNFALGGVVVGSATLNASGVATTTLSGLSGGLHDVTAAYAGDANFLPAAPVLPLEILPAPTAFALVDPPTAATIGDLVTWTASVAVLPPGQGDPTGTVTFYADGTPLGDAPVLAGLATFSTDTLAAGPHLIAAHFDGALDFASGDAQAPISVGKLTATATLDNAPASPVFGESVLMTAVFAPSPPATRIPTGTVNFLLDGAPVASATLSASGVATTTLSGLSGGLHDVTAAYAGDDAFLPAAPALPLEILPAPTAFALVNPPASATAGHPVTWTALVTVLPPGQGDPAGTVTFYADGTPLGDAPVLAGLATFSTDTLAAGPHLISAHFDGALDFASGDAQAPLLVDRATATATLDSAPASPVFGQSVLMTAVFAPTPPNARIPTGTVSFLLDGAPVGSATLNASGVATTTLSGLSGGLHDVTASYAGDANFLPAAPVLPLEILPAPTTFALVDPPAAATIGDLVTWTASVAVLPPGQGDPAGTVTFYADGTPLGDAPVLAGLATFSTDTLAAGPHLISAHFDGALDFASGDAEAPISVGKLTATTFGGTTPIASVYGEAVTFFANLSEPSATGTIQFAVDGVASGPPVALIAGSASSAATSTLTVGTHAVTASYSGDARYAASSSEFTVTVGPAATSTALAIAPTSPVFGQFVTFTASLTVVAPGAGRPQGAVVFSDGATVLGAGLLGPDGKATFTTSALEPGPRAISARYQGDQRFTESASGASSLQVDPAPVLLQVAASPAPSAFGELVNVVVTATADPRSTAVPSGTITLNDGGATLAGLVLDATGQASFATAQLTVGDHALVATLAAAPRFAASTSAPVAHQVRQAGTAVALAATPSPSTFGQPVALTATVSALPPGAGSPSGTVTFLDGGVVLGTGTLDASGVATLATGDAASGALSGGAHTLTATYEGDASFLSQASAPYTQVVSAAPASLVATVAPLRAVFGQPITLSATVSSPAGIPAGQVDFLEGAVRLGSATLDAAGKGALTTSTLGAGEHSITVSYLGGPDHQPASASALAAVDPAATTTVLTASASGSRVGQPVTFSATVRPVAPGAGLVSGLVTFRAGATALGSAALDDTGVASLSVGSLAAGEQTITAAFAGGAAFAGSSGDLLHAVLRAETLVALQVSPSGPATFGQAITLTATVAAVAPGAGTPSAPVTFWDGGALLGSAPVVGGVATFTTAGLGVGPHALRAEYPGDAALAPGSGGATHTVEKGATSVSVASSRNPSRRGRPITLTATVSSPHATAGGTVDFKDGTAVLASVPLVEGVATFTTRDLRKGVHPITVEFAGGDAFASSAGDLAGGQVVENSPPVAGAGTALVVGPGKALSARVEAAGALDQPIGTVELWARATSSLTGRLASREEATAQAGPNLLSLGGASLRWGLGVDTARTGLEVTLGQAVTTVPVDFTGEAWHHLALLAGETSATVLVDGQEVAVIDGHLDATAAGEALLIGQDFTGEVDEVRLWSEVRSPAEVAADARRPLVGPVPGLLALWRMDEASGAEAFDEGPLHLDAVLELEQGSGVPDPFIPSTAWQDRRVGQERALAPAVDAGYDADGDPLALTLTSPAAHGATSLDPSALQIGYQAGNGALGADQFTFELSDGSDSSDYRIVLSIDRILTCQADLDCGGGDLCVQNQCVAPAALSASAGGGCTSGGGGGGALALWSLLALGLITRTRARRGAPVARRIP